MASVRLTPTSPAQQQALRELSELRDQRNYLWRAAAFDTLGSVTFPTLRKLWGAVQRDDSGVVGVGFVAVLLTVPALAFDLLASPFRLLSGLRNAAEAAYYSARVGLRD